MSMFKQFKTVSMALIAGSFACVTSAYADIAADKSAVNVSQQTGKLSGVVSDAAGPVIGASVVVKGTTNGVVTDFDGRFELTNLKKGDVIQINFVGYSAQEITYTGQSSIQVTLKEDTKVLDEVVVVGFGTQKKVNLTGSVGVVDSEALAARPVQNAVQALQGVVPGLNITSAGGALDQKASMNVRGTGTIGEGSSGSPLVLIDGMEGDINSINPQDIENISVLKDAAASSIYGSRAPFGVILVTTKSGKEGKMSVNYNNNFRWSAPVKKPQQMDSYTFALFYNDGMTNNGNQPRFSDGHLQRILDFQSGKLKDPLGPNPGNPSIWADGYDAGCANTDWYDAIYKDMTFSQEHNFSLNGGSEKVSYYVSANYLGQEGLMKLAPDTYDRYTTTAKINVKLTDWARFSYNTRFTREDFERPSYLTESLYYDLARQGWPTLPLYDANGYLYSSPSPALALRDGGRDRTQTDNLYQQATIILEPIKNWITHIDVNYRVQSIDNHWDTQKLYNHDVNGNPIIFNESSEVHEGHSKDNYFNINAYTEYSHSLESGHNFKVMAGFQAENMNYSGFGATREGIIVPELPEMDITSGMDYFGSVVTPGVNGNRSSWATAGFFGRINYDYNGKYMAEVNLRYDGTSRFRRDQRWNLFPSFSLGWNVAHEAFWEPLAEYVGTLKLRGSYGELGNQNTSSWYPTYRVINVYASNGWWLQDGLRPNTAYVPELISSTLGWERVRNWNIGIDFGAFNNRLTGSFDYYNRITKDMVGPAPEMPYILGMKVPTTNNTDLKTYGFDLIVGWQDRLQNGLNYGAKFILSDSQTKITRYPNPTNTMSKYMSGCLMGDIYGYETIGIAKTEEEMQEHLASLPNGGQDALGSKWGAGDVMYRDLNGDGKIDSGAYQYNDMGDMKKIGNSTPRFQFGLDLNADYKGFDIRAFFQGVMKRDYWQGSAYFWGIGGGSGLWHSTGFVEHADYFRNDPEHPMGENLNAYYPRPVFGTAKNGQRQTRYLQDASYIRLKNLQVGYTLPASLTNKWGVSKMRFFLSGENLWTGTSLADMFDPETISGGSYNNGNAYPLSKTISVGLNVTL